MFEPGYNHHRKNSAHNGFQVVSTKVGQAKIPTKTSPAFGEITCFYGAQRNKNQVHFMEKENLREMVMDSVESMLTP